MSNYIKSKQKFQQALTTNIISKYFLILKNTRTYYEKGKPLQSLKKTKIIETSIAHNVHAVSLHPRPINIDATTLSLQNIQPWILWLLKKELIQPCINMTN